MTIPHVPVEADEWHPDEPAYATSSDVAAAFAAAGHYMLPVRATGDAKHAGSVVGKDWPAKSSNTPDQVAAWFAGTDHRAALHCGRSGLIVLDVDHPEHTPEVILQAERELRPPTQYTRPGEQRRHLVFAMPSSRRIGNSTGQLGKAWGDTRGANGIIIVGGRGRRWEHEGPAPTLPDYIADLLPDTGDAQSAVSDVDIAAFVDAHRVALHPQSLDIIVRAFDEAEGSRHGAALSVTCWAVREAIEGRFSAGRALTRLAQEFAEAMATAPNPTDRKLSRAQADAEFNGVVAWAVAQEWRPGAVPPADDDLPDRTATLQERMRAIRVAEQVENLSVRAEAQRVHDLAHRPQRPSIMSGLIDVADLDQIEPPKFLLGGLIPDCAVGFIAGRSGSYKTFLAVSWACAIALGASWLGRDEFAVLGPRKVLYVAAEGAPGAAQRIRAWQAVHGKLGRGTLTLYSLPVQLNEAERVAELDQVIRDERYEFVVFDTFHRSTPGSEDNSSADVGIVFEAAAGFRDRHGCGVLFVDHTGHAGERLRGSSAKGDDADYVLTATYEGLSRASDVQRILTVTKLKDAEDGHHWPVRLIARPGVIAPVLDIGEAAPAAAADDEFAQATRARTRNRELDETEAAVTALVVDADDEAGWASTQDVERTVGRRAAAVRGDLKALESAGRLQKGRRGQAVVWAPASSSHDHVLLVPDGRAS